MGIAAGRNLLEKGLAACRFLQQKRPSAGRSFRRRSPAPAAFAGEEEAAQRRLFALGELRDCGASRRAWQRSGGRKRCTLAILVPSSSDSSSHLPSPPATHAAAAVRPPISNLPPRRRRGLVLTFPVGSRSTVQPAASPPASIMADYEQEQEMEVEALQAILMDDIKEIDPSESGIATTARCFQILLSPQDDDFDESAYVPVQLALIFAHTEKYPDEPPLLNVKSVRGIKPNDLVSLKEKLEQEATENLGMAMVYTLVSSAKEWLSEKYGQNDGDEEPEEAEAEEEEVIIPHGEAVTVESFLAWRDRFEAELALQRAKLMPDSALTAPKEKKLTGRQYFESGRHAVKGASTVADEDEEEEEDIEFDDDFEDDEEDMLEHYLAEQSGKSTA